MLDLHAAVLSEHAVFVRTAEALEPEDWERPSWCRDWTVRDVVVHVAGHVHHSQLLRTRVGDLGRSHFRPTVAATREVHRHRALSREAVLEWLSRPLDEHMSDTDSIVQLAELTIHGADISRPLGLDRTVDAELDVGVARMLLDYGMTRLGSLSVAGARSRARGLRIEATDTNWGYGDGLQVSGPAMSLVFALNGRAGALDDLSGDGVAALRLRMKDTA